MRPSDSAHRNTWLWPAALCSLAAFALVLRWYYASTAIVMDPIRGDAGQYYSYAWNLVHQGIFSKAAPGTVTVVPDNYRDPGYPLFLALWMKALGTGGAWYASVLITQAVLGTATVVLVTQLGKNWLTARWAIGAGALMGAWPHSIVMSSFLLTETLFGFLVALALALVSRSARTKSPWWACMAGLAFGAAALTNAVMLPFGPLLAGFLNWRRLAPTKICAALAVGALLLPGAWAIRNAQLVPSQSGTSSTDRAMQNFVQGSWPEYHAAWRTSIFGDTDARRNALATLGAINRNYIELRNSPADGSIDILRRLGKNPLKSATWYLGIKPTQLWGWSIQVGQGDIYAYPTKNSPFQIIKPWIAWEAICRASNPIILFLAMASIITVWRDWDGNLASPDSHNQIGVIIVIFLLAFVTSVYAILQAEPRYSIPFRATELLLAFTTTARLGARLGDLRRGQRARHGSQPSHH